MSRPIILVAIDQAPSALVAIGVARTLADALGATLHILHADSGGDVAVARVAASAALRDAARDDWSVDVVGGAPAEVVLDKARAMHPRMIVVCAHEPGTHKILGRTAFSILQQAECPVALVPPGHRSDQWRIRKILLAHDGSPSGNAAVESAVALACGTGGDLLIQVIGSTATVQLDKGSLPVPSYVDQPQHEWPIWSEELLQRLACECREQSVEASLSVRGGSPPDEILRVAREKAVDLIVLSWKGDWSGLHAATLKGVLRGADCPVVVARAC